MRGAGTILVTAGVLWLLTKEEGSAVQQQGSGTPPPRGNIERSLQALVPAFRERVMELLSRMRAQGHRPLVWETYRSPSRAAKLAESGEGIALSQHTLGLAVDIVDATRMWGAPAVFWESLHRIALELNLGRIKHRDKNGNLVWDLPHVQALPGSQDGKMRALATLEKREEFLRRHYVA